MNTNGSYNSPCGDRSSLLRRVLNLVGLNSTDTAAAAAAAAPSTDSEDEQDTRLRAEAQQPDRLQLSPTGVRANGFKLSASWQPTQKSAARPIKIAPALAAHSVLTMDSLPDFPWLPDSEELQGARAFRALPACPRRASAPAEERHENARRAVPGRLCHPMAARRAETRLPR